MTHDFECDGAVHVQNFIDVADWLEWLSSLEVHRPGIRLNGRAGLRERVGIGSVLYDAAAKFIGCGARPVRAILFDKGEGNNWPLGWHQDRTIAVSERHDSPGYGPWTVKGGVTHVEPPFALLKNMVTIRAHLDDVGNENAPLRISPGSHRFGRILERDYAAVIDACGEFECLASAGDIWLYATPILHASDIAKRLNRRRVLQVDYSANALPTPLEWAYV